MARAPPFTRKPCVRCVHAFRSQRTHSRSSPPSVPLCGLYPCAPPPGPRKAQRHPTPFSHCHGLPWQCHWTDRQTRRQKRTHTRSSLSHHTRLTMRQQCVKATDSISISTSRGCDVRCACRAARKPRLPSWPPLCLAAALERRRQGTTHWQSRNSTLRHVSRAQQLPAWAVLLTAACCSCHARPMPARRRPLTTATTHAAGTRTQRATGRVLAPRKRAKGMRDI
jgi:hypothetical protein